MGKLATSKAYAKLCCLRNSADERRAVRHCLAREDHVERLVTLRRTARSVICARLELQSRDVSFAGDKAAETATIFICKSFLQAVSRCQCCLDPRCCSDTACSR